MRHQSVINQIIVKKKDLHKDGDLDLDQEKSCRNADCNVLP